MNNNKSEIIDIKGLLRKCRRKWYVMLVWGLIFGAFGYAYTMILKPKYEVNASMQLQDSTNFSAMISGGLSGVADFLGGNVDGEDEVQIATSHTVLSQVCMELGINCKHMKRLRPLNYELLYPNYPIDVTPGHDILVDTLRSEVMFLVKMHDGGKADVTVTAGGNKIYSASEVGLPVEMPTTWGTFTLVPTEHFDKVEAVKYRITLTSPNLAAAELRRNINVGLATKNSKIIEFQMFSPNVDYAIDVINTIMAKYVLRAENQHISENNAMAKFLEQRIALISESLNNTEQEIVTTRQSKGITNLAMGGQTVGERVAKAESDLQQRMLAVEMTKLTLEMVKAAASDNGLIPMQLENEAISGMIGTYNNLVLRRKQLEGSAKGDNAALQRLDEQISDMRANLISTLEVSLAQAQEAQDNYQARYDGIISEIGDIPGYEYRTHSVYRTRAIEEEIYIFLLKKQEETAMLLSKLDDSALIIDPAYSTYEDLSMSPKMIIIVAFICGLMLPPVWYYFRRDKGARPARKPEDDEEE